LTQTAQAPNEFTTDEIRAAIESFDAATQLRLEKVAKIYAQGRGIEADDLLQDAVVKSLTGKRICPRTVSIPTFLANTMRSLASSALKTKRNSKLDNKVDVFDSEAIIENTDQSDPGPEECILEAESQDQVIRAMDKLFSDDPEAQLVLFGLCQDMTRDEIQKDCQLSDKEYATIRRRIRRKLNQHYPKGWKP